jgi:hypothetical protein
MLAMIPIVNAIKSIPIITELFLVAEQVLLTARGLKARTADVRHANFRAHMTVRYRVKHIVIGAPMGTSIAPMRHD